MKLFKQQNNELVALSRRHFELERDIQNLVEFNLPQLFDLIFVTSEFKVGDFRIDTLAFDESSNSFVIIEYKKGNSYSVVDQGYSYLSTMVNNKAEFILEYNEQTNDVLKRADVDWTSSRVLFIAPSFNAYQKNSVNFSDVKFELWEIRNFEDGLIAFEQIESTSSESIEKIAPINEQSLISKVNSEVKTFSEEDHTSNMSEKTQKLWILLRERLLNLCSGSFNATKSYIGYKSEASMICFIKFRKDQINVDILRGREKPDGNFSRNFFTFDDPKKLAKEKSWTRKSGAIGMSYSIPFKNIESIDYVMFLVNQKYEALN